MTARKDPTIIGAGRPRTFGDNQPKGPVDWSTVGRNDPCPCGSGKKFKKCHGAPRANGDAWRAAADMLRGDDVAFLNS